MAVGTYAAVTNIRHQGVRYLAGATVELTEEEAAHFGAAVEAAKPAPKSKSKAAAKPADDTGGK